MVDDRKVGPESKLQIPDGVEWSKQLTLEHLFWEGVFIALRTNPNAGRGSEWVAESADEALIEWRKRWVYAEPKNASMNTLGEGQRG